MSLPTASRRAPGFKIGVLTKIKNTPGRPAVLAEGHTVRGIVADDPTVNEPFYIQPTEGPSGLFSTSKVLNVVNDELGHFIIDTANSQYRLEILPR